MGFQWIATRAGSVPELVPDEFRHRYAGWRLAEAPVHAPVVEFPMPLDEALARAHMCARPRA